MDTLIVLLVASVAVHTSATVLPGSATPNPLIPVLDGRVVNGVSASIAEVPYLVSVRRQYGSSYSHFCGGVIIGGNIVLSAGHCFTANPEPSVWRVVAGASLLNSGGTWHQVIDIIIHPNYVSVFYDIAILVIKGTFSFGTNVANVTIAPPGYSIADGTATTVSGWGSLYFQGSASNQLQKAEVYTVNQNECRTNYSQLVTITSHMLCAGTSASDGPIRDACSGDSGGPLVDDTGVLVGLVSFGEECALENYPGVYTRVSEMANWVSSEISDRILSGSSASIAPLSALLIFTLLAFIIR